MEYVENLLKEKKVYFKYQGQDLVIKCLNPEHEDSDPSMRIDRVDGKFNCFSCGFKGNIFKYYGIITNTVSIKIAKLKEKLVDLQMDLKGLEYPDGYTPFNTSFRGISKETLKQFGAFYTDRIEELNDRIIFPITDTTGNILVFVARHVLSDAQPKYINYPRNRRIPAFPVRISKEFKSIILVEGIFDFLNCYDKGLHNVVCTFGTQTLLSSTKIKLIPYKAQGITKIYLMFDGDDAGNNAAVKLKPIIEECGFIVEIIRLPNNLDPGILNQEFINSIKEYLNENNLA